MIKGTRVLIGKDASIFFATLAALREALGLRGYQEIYISSLANPQLFVDKAGNEILNQMWNFHDKGGREVCLVPEITGVIQELYKQSWEKSEKKPMKVFYVNRCYRYEKPQMGRYREFTQVGVEVLGGEYSQSEIIDDLEFALQCTELDLNYKLETNVKRGLNYYTEDGFEVIVENLGAQKQIAGGGAYPEGIGWAIGLDRLVLAIQNSI